MFLWCHQESNRGHKDFQSFALPTELWHHCLSFAVAKVGIFFDSTNFLQIFCEFLFDFKKMLYLCTRKTETECSAVGSALRSGRRGRAFESPHSDTVKDKRVCQNSLFEEITPATTICRRGETFCLGIMTHPLILFLKNLFEASPKVH